MQFDLPSFLDRKLFGSFPGNDKFYLATCPICKGLLKAQALYEHVVKRHKDGTGAIPHAMNVNLSAASSTTTTVKGKSSKYTHAKNSAVGTARSHGSPSNRAVGTLRSQEQQTASGRLAASASAPSALSDMGGDRSRSPSASRGRSKGAAPVAGGNRPGRPRRAQTTRPGHPSCSDKGQLDLVGLLEKRTPVSSPAGYSGQANAEEASSSLVPTAAPTPPLSSGSSVGSASGELESQLQAELPFSCVGAAPRSRASSSASASAQVSDRPLSASSLTHHKLESLPRNSPSSLEQSSSAGEGRRGQGQGPGRNAFMKMELEDVKNLGPVLSAPAIATKDVGGVPPSGAERRGIKRDRESTTSDPPARTLKRDPSGKFISEQRATTYSRSSASLNDSEKGRRSEASSPAGGPTLERAAEKLSCAGKKGPKPSRCIPCKDRAYDPDKHCGCWIQSLQTHCTRSLTCKTHALSHRRKVPNRSKPFDTLLQESRNERERQKNLRMKGMASPSSAPATPAPAPTPPSSGESSQSASLALGGGVSLGPTARLLMSGSAGSSMLRPAIMAARSSVAPSGQAANSMTNGSSTSDRLLSAPSQGTTQMVYSSRHPRPAALATHMGRRVGGVTVATAKLNAFRGVLHQAVEMNQRVPPGRHQRAEEASTIISMLGSPPTGHHASLSSRKPSAASAGGKALSSAAENHSARQLAFRPPHATGATSLVAKRRASKDLGSGRKELASAVGETSSSGGSTPSSEDPKQATQAMLRRLSDMAAGVSSHAGASRPALPSGASGPAQGTGARSGPGQWTSSSPLPAEKGQLISPMGQPSAVAAGALQGDRAVSAAAVSAGAGANVKIEPTPAGGGLRTLMPASVIAKHKKRMLNGGSFQMVTNGAIGELTNQVLQRTPSTNQHAVLRQKPEVPTNQHAVLRQKSEGLVAAGQLPPQSQAALLMRRRASVANPSSATTGTPAAPAGERASKPPGSDGTYIPLSYANLQTSKPSATATSVRTETANPASLLNYDSSKPQSVVKGSSSTGPAQALHTAGSTRPVPISGLPHRLSVGSTLAPGRGPAQPRQIVYQQQVLPGDDGSSALLNRALAQQQNRQRLAHHKSPPGGQPSAPRPMQLASVPGAGQTPGAGIGAGVGDMSAAGGT